MITHARPSATGSPAPQSFQAPPCSSPRPAPSCSGEWQPPVWRPSAAPAGGAGASSLWGRAKGAAADACSPSVMTTSLQLPGGVRPGVAGLHGLPAGYSDKMQSLWCQTWRSEQSLSAWRPEPRSWRRPAARVRVRLRLARPQEEGEGGCVCFPRGPANPNQSAALQGSEPAAGRGKPNLGGG